MNRAQFLAMVASVFGLPSSGKTRQVPNAPRAGKRKLKPSRKWDIKAIRTQRGPVFRFAENESAPSTPGMGWRYWARKNHINRKHVSRGEIIGRYMVVPKVTGKAVSK